MRKIVGLHSVNEVFKIRPDKIKVVTLKRDWETNADLKEIHALATARNIPVKKTSVVEIDKICEGNQGVMIEVAGEPEFPWEDLKGDAPALVLGLDGLEDPQNLGNILRTSWLLNTKGILITESKSVGLTPTVCKIASGGAEHVGVETYNQLFQPLKQLKEQGFWVYGFSEKAEKSIWDTEFHHKCVIVAGSEMKGMRPQTIKECDELIKIPQIDAEASLNVATSISIGIAEFCRQHTRT
jgi:23S rRNA (guanosine2251-2'-O)-methyltransferase